MKIKQSIILLIFLSVFVNAQELNTVIGVNAGNGSYMGPANTICGNYAGNLLIGGHNSFYGNQSGRFSINGNYNSFFGYYSGINNSNGNYNSFFGAKSGYSSLGNYNTYLGYYTGNSNYGGSYNVFIGSNAGVTSEVGSYNTFLGTNAGYNNDGNANVFIGYNSGYNESNSNRLYIENSSSNTPLIYGEFDNNILKINGDFSIGESNGIIAIVAIGDTGETVEHMKNYVSSYPVGLLKDTIEFLKDQYYRTDDYSIFYEMNDQGVVNFGNQIYGTRCEGVQIFTIDDDSLDYSFASDIFSIGNQETATYLFWISRDSLYYDGCGIFDSTYTLITGWADYILKGSFQKPEFKEIQLFWETNSHLPWIPSNGGVNKNGYVNQGRLLKQITEAVEYNYLYDAELREEVERLKNENEQLKRQIYLIYKALNK